MTETDNSHIGFSPADTDQGTMERVFALESIDSENSTKYDPKTDLATMQLMRQVLANRLKNPGAYGAHNATKIADLITAKNQFANLATYPNLDKNQTRIIDTLQDSANNPASPYYSVDRQHLKNIIQAASENIDQPKAAFPRLPLG